MARRILIVDNHEDSTEALRILFEMHGHEVDTATTGEAGIARAATGNPDVVILDLGLPDIDGEVVATAMKSDGRRPFIVAYSGYHLRRPAALAAGCDAFLLKPSLAPLIALVGAAFEQQQRRTC